MHSHIPQRVSNTTISYQASKPGLDFGIPGGFRGQDTNFFFGLRAVTYGVPSLLSTVEHIENLILGIPE
ncbi:MAG: hypothetical protein AMJ46_13980 [Latescibacteria bacterium DG_63]|nr:MAG: hypothetical protein AMJ46_13980 [Latescibacteria bacterium DG_63]